MYVPRNVHMHAHMQAHMLTHIHAHTQEGLGPLPSVSSQQELHGVVRDSANEVFVTLRKQCNAESVRRSPLIRKADITGNAFPGYALLPGKPDATPHLLADG
jgi:hypothetical protein